MAMTFIAGSSETPGTCSTVVVSTTWAETVGLREEVAVTTVVSTVSLSVPAGTGIVTPTVAVRPGPSVCGGGTVTPHSWLLANVKVKVSVVLPVLVSVWW